MGNKEAISSSVITGTGEFERKEYHALSTVVVRNGIIESVDFVVKPEVDAHNMDSIVQALAGKQISKILEMDVREWDSMRESTSNIQAFEVLLEAFHRAVETCLDR